MAKKKRENKIQKEINASVRTGTKKREKKKNYSSDELLINRVVRRTPLNGTKEKRMEIQYGLGFSHECTKELILENTNDEVTLEFNASRLKKQRRSVKELALILNRMNIPLDLSNIILSKSLNNIYIEKNIFKILPTDILDVFHSKDEGSILEKENDINNLIKKYMKNDHIYNFLEAVLIDELWALKWRKVKIPIIRRRLTYNDHYYDGYIIDQFN
jgi:hypothetical protein